MADLAKNTLQLNELIRQGNSFKAIELFYADNVSMLENEDMPRIGKQACLENERKNLLNIKEVKSNLLNQALDLQKNVVFSEWEIFFTTKTDKKFLLREISVQHWENEKIIKEKFYYKEFIPV